MQTTSERLKQIIDERDIKQTDLVKLTGISKGALSSYISGKYEPKQTNIYKIAKVLNINEAWLMGYDVPMNKADVDVSIISNDSIVVSDEKELQLLERFRKLNILGKDKATDYIDDLLETSKYVD